MPSAGSMLRAVLMNSMLQSCMNSRAHQSVTHVCLSLCLTCRFSIDRLSMEVAAMGKQPEAPDVVAERARLVFTTLVSPSPLDLCTYSHHQLFACMAYNRAAQGLQWIGYQATPCPDQCLETQGITMNWH